MRIDQRLRVDLETRFRDGVHVRGRPSFGDARAVAKQQAARLSRVHGRGEGEQTLFEAGRDLHRCVRRERQCFDKLSTSGPGKIAQPKDRSP